jgi:hypothetical protein
MDTGRAMPSCRARPKTRKRTFEQLAWAFARKIDQTLASHKHLRGLDESFVLVVCGCACSGSHQLITPRDWDNEEILSTLDHLLLNIDEWGQVEHPHSGNVHEFARGFMDWVDTQVAIYPNARETAILVAHRDGATTFAHASPGMKLRTIATAEHLAEVAFARGA